MVMAVVVIDNYRWVVIVVTMFLFVVDGLVSRILTAALLDFEDG